MAVYSVGYEYTTDSGNAAEIIKSFYDDGVREAHYKATPLFNRLKRVVPTQRVGNDFVISIKVGPNPGFGGVIEGGTMPAAGPTPRDTATVPVKEVAQTISLTNKLLAVARGDKTSFVNALTDAISNATEAFIWNTDRMMWGDGTGFICAISSASGDSTSNTITCYVANASDVRMLQEGAYVDVMDASNTTTPNNGTSYHAVVTAVTPSDTTNSTTFVLALQSGSTWAATVAADNVLSAGPLSSRTYDASGTANSYYEWMGLKGIVSASDPTTGDLQGLDRATYTWWKASAKSASANRPVTEKLMIEMAQECQKKGGEPTAIYCDYDQLKNYAIIQTANVMHTDIAEITGGFNGLRFQYGVKPIPVFGIYQCTPNAMYFVDESHLFFVQAGDMEWIPGAAGGGVLHWDVGTSQKVGAIEWFGNLATDHPASCGLLNYLEK